VPIRTRWGCWSLVSSHTTAEFLYTWIARPFWAMPESQIAAAVYLTAAIVVLLLVGGVTRSLRHFRKVAHAIREGRTQHFTFSSRNVVPELGSVANDFDALALDLRNVARDIRRAAEDNAHSFKSPVATIEASLETAKRSLGSDQTAVRAFDLITISIERLKALISASQQLDNITADLIEAPRARIDLGVVIGGVMDRFDDLMVEREITLARSIKDKMFINGSTEILEIALENIIDNAISFAPRGSTISVTLNKSAQFADLFIDDEGPGIDAQKVAYIFDRYFSLRPATAANDDPEVGLPHAGLGLWIVRRNIEALGGTVTATNLPNSGLRLHIILPLSGRR
jgi:two-component system sensor histidine kinase ChvG